MKNIFKLGFLSFGFFLLVLNCQQDDQNQNLENSDEIQDIISREVSFEKSPHFSKVSKVYNKLKSDLNSPNSLFSKSSEESDITLFTDKVLFMEYADTHTYTFKLLRDNPEFYIENIVIHFNIDTEDYDEYLVQYDVEVGEYQDLLDSFPLREDTEVKISKLASGTISSLFSKSSCFRAC
ncbi:hypothetical protein [Algibacter aquimarinus]|uniref:hypothetical protein n=1 Tax=Algibacter aquimarinus TaxID=1136748 RepID=UPI0031EECE84